MMIQDIRLQHFRSYDDDSFEFSPSVNIIVGPNASGKTNLLEAILVLARGNSYRARDSELVEFGQPWARLDALVDDTLRTLKLTNLPGPEKVFELSGRNLKRLNLSSSLPVVLFEPDHLSLLGGSPEKRREYLDDLITQTVSGYGTTVRSYRRVLAQRNALLKRGQMASQDQLFPWNLRLSELAGTVVRARAQLVESMNKIIGKLYKDLSNTTTKVFISYRASAAAEQYESHMLHQLEARTSDDLLRGFTSFGPHREDFEVKFGGHPAEEVASRGEVRTLLLGLKIIELQLLEKVREKSPLLLLDDVFSELDGARRRALTTHLTPYQTFITTTDADVVVKHFAEQSNIILVSKTGL